MTIILPADRLNKLERRVSSQQLDPRLVEQARVQLSRRIVKAIEWLADGNPPTNQLEHALLRTGDVEAALAEFIAHRRRRGE